MVYLYNWGEPLLNKNIAIIIELFHKKGIFTSMSSNLSLECDKQLEDICDAGLDHLDPSIDGATQEVYQKYRIKGNIQKALDNIKYLIKYRKKKRRKNPIIDWQFLEFKHNIHEIEAARKISSDIGVDRFFTRHGYTPNDKTEISEHSGDKVVKSKCNLLYRSIVINGDYSLAPCCYLYNKSDDFGNLRTDTIMTIRNNKKYIFARSLFSSTRRDELIIDPKHPCVKCRNK